MLCGLWFKLNQVQIYDESYGLSETAPEAEDEMEGGLLLDVVVSQGPAILELLAREDESLLVGRDAFLVLDFGLDVLNGVGGLDIEGDGLSCEGFDEDLHLFAGVGLLL